jgi:hypothetical protein
MEGCFQSIRGPSFNQYAFIGRPTHHPSLPTYQIRLNLKASCFSSLEFPLVGFVTLVEDPKEVSWSLIAINETLPSLIHYHSSQYCYATKFSPSHSLSLSLSLSHIIVILLHWFWFLKSLEQHCCYNLFPFDNTEIALEELWRSRFVWMCHLFVR